MKIIDEKMDVDRSGNRQAVEALISSGVSANPASVTFRRSLLLSKGKALELRSPRVRMASKNEEPPDYSESRQLRRRRFAVSQLRTYNPGCAFGPLSDLAHIESFRMDR